MTQTQPIYRCPDCQRWLPRNGGPAPRCDCRIGDKQHNLKPWSQPTMYPAARPVELEKVPSGLTEFL